MGTDQQKSERLTHPSEQARRARPSVAGSKRVQRAHAPSADAETAPAQHHAVGDDAPDETGTKAARVLVGRADAQERGGWKQAPRKAAADQRYIPLWNDEAGAHPRITRRLFIRGAAACLLAAGVLGAAAWRRSLPIAITVNGQAVELSEQRTLQGAIDAAGLTPAPGNLVDIAGEIAQEGGGTPFQATINGAACTDANAAVSEGATLTIADGSDVEEPSTVEDKTVGPNPVEHGYGPIHAVESEGASGVSTVKTGAISGKEVVVEVIEPAADRVYRRSYPDTGGEAVIALTFDDGPWDTSTAAILDILRDNGARATFFTVGNRIAGTGIDAVKRAHAEGHQVCTHTWDHAAGNGKSVSLALMTPEEQRDEIERGRQAIADVVGEEASRVIRAPGGNFPLEVWRNVEDLVEADIGWDIDTLDWKRPGAEVIASRIKAATPGDIILMHDGGGDRSQTAEALKTALPFLKEKGFRFATVDEMLAYPRKDL